MSKVCILTDGTAQFTQPDYAGHELVQVVPFQMQAPLPARSTPKPTPRLSPPTARDFSNWYSLLGREFGKIMVLTLSSSLSEAGRNARQAAARCNGRLSIEVVDSQTTAVGLGLLVQLAAEAAQSGAGLAEIKSLIRFAVANIYTLICVPELSYLSAAGYLSPSQAIIGEMLGMKPIFVLEDGRLAPIGKVRTQRRLFESFLDFIEEFDKPWHIAFLKPSLANPFRTRSMQQGVNDIFPQAPFSEHVIEPPFVALFGRQCMGLVVAEQ